MPVKWGKSARYFGKLEIVVRGTPDSWDNLYVEKLLILHKSYNFFSTKLLFITSSVNGKFKALFVKIH